MEDVGPLAGPLADALARGRSEYNARVSAARLSPALVPTLLGALRSLDPVVRAVHARDPAAVEPVVGALFDAALELVPRGRLGPGARTPEVDAAFRALLTASSRMLLVDPRRVVAAVVNALTRLAESAGPRLGDWVSLMTALAERAVDVDTWLRAGTVAAWRSGLAHAREGALDACALLPVELAAVALGLEATTDAGAVARVLERLRADPWTWPPHVLLAGEPPPRGIKLIGYVGGFRGFGCGGRFIAPPRVGWRDGRFVVTDGERAFELHADSFGATLVGTGPVGPAFEPPHARGALVLSGGEVRRGEHARGLPGLADVTSWASTDSTLVAARPITHQLTLFAWSGYGL